MKMVISGTRTILNSIQVAIENGEISSEVLVEREIDIEEELLALCGEQADEEQIKEVMTEKLSSLMKESYLKDLNQYIDTLKTLLKEFLPADLLHTPKWKNVIENTRTEEINESDRLLDHRISECIKAIEMIRGLRDIYTDESIDGKTFGWHDLSASCAIGMQVNKLVFISYKDALEEKVHHLKRSNERKNKKHEERLMLGKIIEDNFLELRKRIKKDSDAMKEAKEIAVKKYLEIHKEKKKCPSSNTIETWYTTYKESIWDY